MATNLYKTSSVKKLNGISFTQSSQKYLSKIIDKEFRMTNCKVKALDIVTLAINKKLQNADFLSKLYTQKFINLN